MKKSEIREMIKEEIQKLNESDDQIWVIWGKHNELKIDNILGTAHNIEEAKKLQKKITQFYKEFGDYTKINLSTAKEWNKNHKQKVTSKGTDF